VPRLADLRLLLNWKESKRVGFDSQREQLNRSRRTRIEKRPSRSVHMGSVFTLFVVVLYVCVPSVAQDPPVVPQTPHSVFVFLQRTSGHVEFSKPQVFEAVVDDVFAYLNSKNVSLASDEFGGRRSSMEEMPLDNVQKIARDSGADSLLYLTVDRPLAKWIRVVANCYASSGTLLWTVEADSGSSITGPITGGQGLRAALKTLRRRLGEYLGKEGLPLKAGVEQRGGGQGKTLAEQGGSELSWSRQ
jgi:hypothetical protein